MQFNKGTSGNPAGRPSRSQMMMSLRKNIEYRMHKFLDDNFDLLEHLDAPKALQKARIYCEILKLTMARSIIKHNDDVKFEEMSTDQLDSIAEMLMIKAMPHYSLAGHPELKGITDSKEFVQKVMDMMLKNEKKQK